MMLRLLLALFLANILTAQNITHIEPQECYLARADTSNLNFVSAYSTTVYALSRALKPGLALFNGAMKARRDDPETNRFLAGILTGFSSLEGKGSVLLSGMQVMATLSLLAPMYWYHYNQLSNAECEYAKNIRVAPNSTKPLECYKADAHDSTAVFETSYAWGLYVGVSMVLPFLIKSISRWTKGCCGGDTEEKQEPAEQGHSILAGGLDVASMPADKYALIDAEAFTMVVAYVVPMIFFGLTYPARAKCDFALANRTRT